ncbi:MAG: glycoside hydrolase family 3 C-terminal domain-containing protein [Clostridia bacterium]|nr:glycoside hydrolase family 3 C-terminal domain-containing protein [Clostridia bacterium]
MIWQGGMEGGLATADILVGDVTPSGKLVDICARNFDDYPSSVGFHESEDYVKYTEDVFVG